MMKIEKYLCEFPADQDQISRAELKIILTEFSRILEEKIPGDVVEFGCYKGETSEFFAKMLNDFSRENDEKKSQNSDENSSEISRKNAENSEKIREKNLWLYDSFEGLPAKTKEDFSAVGQDFQKGKLFAKKSKIEEKFAKMGLKNVRIIKGFFAEIADRKVPREICFAFFDGDFYDSIRASFEKCAGKFAEKSTIIIDDYSNEKLPGARKIVDEWRAQNAEKILRFREENSLAIIYLK